MFISYDKKYTNYMYIKQLLPLTYSQGDLALQIQGLFLFSSVMECKPCDLFPQYTISCLLTFLPKQRVARTISADANRNTMGVTVIKMSTNGNENVLVIP